MEAYDSISVIAETIKMAGSTEADAIVTAHENIDYDSALGKIYFPYGIPTCWTAR